MLDSSVMSGLEIYSDHYLLMSKIIINLKMEPNLNHNKKEIQTVNKGRIRVYLLKE